MEIPKSVYTCGLLIRFVKFFFPCLLYFSLFTAISHSNYKVQIKKIATLSPKSGQIKKKKKKRIFFTASMQQVT